MANEQVALNLEKDLNEIAALIWGYMDKKYISELKNKINGYRQECRENLGSEAQLIRALIPFMAEEKKVLELVLDLIIYNDMIERSFKEYDALTNLYRDEDGDKEKLKKLTYKLILFKLITVIEKESLGS